VTIGIGVKLEAYCRHPTQMRLALCAQCSPKWECVNQAIFKIDV
jgi:hypothetical protein